MGRYARPSQVRRFSVLQKSANYLFRHLNHTLLTLDGNFHANRYKKNSTPDDYSLFAGRAYFPKDADFKGYLRSLPAKDINDVCESEGVMIANITNFEIHKKIDCPIKAVKSQYKCADNLAETGVINVQCPDVIVRSTVDLQRGERYFVPLEIGCGLLMQLRL